MGRLPKDSIENHGDVITSDKSIVSCKYCGKEVPGYKLLKYHLAGIGPDISACPHVAPACKLKWKNHLKKSKITIGQRSSGRQSVGSKNGKVKNVGVTIKEEVTDATMNVDVLDANTTIEEMDANINGESTDDGSSNFKRCVATFFYEAGVDHSVFKLPSFMKMFDAAINCGQGLKMPAHDELTGSFLQQKLEEVRKRIGVMKQSWALTGCSILLDTWIDKWDRNIIGFLVDCPDGTVFLRSVDATHAFQGTDINALVSIIGSVIEEVGVLNVVQVISPSCSDFMEAVGKMLVEKYNRIFWTVCFDTCIELILQKMESIAHVEKILTEAKKIAKFVYNDSMMRTHFTRRELVVSSTLKAIASFRTLKNIESMRKDLVSMFASQAWSSGSEGENIYQLIRSPFFWASVDVALKFAIPFLRVFDQINTTDGSPMGFLYDAMDTAKEELRQNLGDDEAVYMPYWNTVDDIWDTYLHSHLHSFAYFLNPCFLYSKNCNVDAEILNGIENSVLRMTRDEHQQELVSQQLGSYRSRLGGFADPKAIDVRTDVSPVTWWSSYGGRTPELQQLATRILSQTCSTTSCYKLRKGVNEKFLSPPRSTHEIQLFSDMEFVRNNLRLMQPRSSNDIFDNDVHLHD